MVEQLRQWFGDRGVPILALGGYASQTYADEVKTEVAARGRKSVLLYAGDLDPSGEHIGDDFVRRSDCWDEAFRVALTVDQVTDHDLPMPPGKESDSRARRFVERHGALVQVELEALPPEALRAEFAAAVAPWWDDVAYTEALGRENSDRSAL